MLALLVVLFVGACSPGSSDSGDSPEDEPSEGTATTTTTTIPDAEDTDRENRHRREAAYLARLERQSDPLEVRQHWIEWGYATCDMLENLHPYALAEADLARAEEEPTIEGLLRSLETDAKRYIAVAADDSLCPRNQEQAALAAEPLTDALRTALGILEDALDE